jgi:general secretion pathway protein K
MMAQKGTVLVTVMLMVAVAALIATEIAYRQQMDILRTGAFLARDMAGNYLTAAEELGLKALRTDREEDDRDFRSNNAEISDHWGEEWNKGGMFPIPGGIGIIEGRLIDLQGRFNVNSMMDTDPNRQAKFRSVFKAILDKVMQDHPEAFPEGVTTQMLLDRTIDWIDIDQDTTGFDGMEDDEYFRKERPYRAANQVIYDPSELLLIEGFTPQALSYMEDKLSFLPLNAKINLYTADKNFLVQLGFDMAEVEAFDKLRPLKVGQKLDAVKNQYTDFNALFTALQGAPATPPPTQPGGATPNPITPPTPGGGGTTPTLQPDMFDVKSQFFLLKGKAVVNGKPVLIESVIWKPELNPAGGGAGAGAGGAGNPNSAANQTTEVTTIFRKFVDPLKQTN